MIVLRQYVQCAFAGVHFHTLSAHMHDQVMPALLLLTDVLIVARAETAKYIEGPLLVMLRKHYWMVAEVSGAER